MIVRKIIRMGEPLTAEQKAELEALKNLRDEDIDLSDIPELTEEQLKKFRRVNPVRKPATASQS